MSVQSDIIQNRSNMKEIMDLVKLLRQNGDEVLSASSKLSLSTKLLQNLNEAFSLIVDESEELESSFQVCNSSKIDVFRDLKFLHDFVQKTVGLKITHCTTDDQISVDITKFRHLKFLELKKVCIALVTGIQGIRSQLESIICAGRRGVTTINQLLAMCGGDVGVGFIWSSLRHLSLSHNALEQLDMSLALAPWLQTLNLSHNLIKSAAELECLPNLKHINLGYNKLETIPTFNKAALHSIQVLVLKNNYIENINGLQELKHLTELDLSFNCLAEHTVLWPIAIMSTLLWISLEGNPLAYHPKHRILTMKYLHLSVIDNKFVLDRISLTKAEKLLVNNHAFSIKTIRSMSRENLISSSSSFNSNNVSTFLDATTSEELIIQNLPAELCSTLEENFIKCKRKANVKEAIIAENKDEKEEEFEGTSNASFSTDLITSIDHLETKKQILALRKKFGEVNWLSSCAGSVIQDIMGMQSVSDSTLSSSPITQNFFDSDILSTNDCLTISVDHTNDPTGEHNLKLDEDIKSEEKEYVENTKEELDENKMSNDEINYTIEKVINAQYDPEQENGDLYLVQKKKNLDEIEEIFLVITSDNIMERDTLTGNVKCCWSITSVLSCVLGRSEPITVDIIFDTTRENRQNRTYFVELDDAKKIVATIGETINARSMSLKVFKCMKCSTHFSQDEEYTTMNVMSISDAKQLKCPTCGSTLVVQTDELSPLNVENEELPKELSLTKEQNLELPNKINLQHSESISSIGGTEGEAISVTTSLVHFDTHSQAQVCCSATSLEDSRESTPSASTLTKKYESDIEILSNPSQSSIEVLDEASRTNLTPNRKRSSEERRTAIAPSLLTIPDTAPVMAGLTESSSSGSLTDSICTAYENRVVRQVNNNEKSLSDNTEKDFSSMTNITTMLGDLLQSIKIASNKTSLLKTEDESHFLTNGIQYSYTDFSSVDHRIKLHIVLNIFEHENEELVLLLRADILMDNSKDIFPGCLLLSTSKVYILKINGLEGEDPQRWLHKECSWTMDRLRSFSPLPYKQGVLIELQQHNKFGEEYINITLLCILQDFQRTSNFLFYITELPLPASCEIEFSVPERCSTLMYNLLMQAKDHQDGDTVRILALYTSATLKYQNISTKLNYSGLIVTSSVLVILEDNMQWLMPNSKVVPVIIKEQAISNLIAIEHCNTSLTLSFLHEIEGLEETWTLEFVSTDAAEAVINSVQSPWEELFSVPLQVTTRMVQSDEKL